MHWLTTMCRKLADFFFPTITPYTKEELAKHKRQLDEQLKEIDEVNWNKCPEVALEHASKLAESEAQRRRTAESKATIYLAVITALVPLVLTVQAAAWEEKVGPAPSWLRLILLAIAVMYISAAAFYAFRTLEVKGFHTLGISDLVAAWKTRKTTNRLVKSILSAVRESQSAVNAKVTQIKLTHLHMMRALLAFVCLLLIDPAFLALDNAGIVQSQVAEANDLKSKITINVSLSENQKTTKQTVKPDPKKKNVTEKKFPSRTNPSPQIAPDRKLIEGQ